MHTQFSDPLDLSSNGRRIFARGPLEWADADQGHTCHITVTLTQGSLSVGPIDAGTYQYDQDWWWCRVEVPSGSQWNPALPVQCHGVVTMSAPPAADVWPDQTVTLDQASAAAA
jgi:hypothetical protein